MNVHTSHVPRLNTTGEDELSWLAEQFRLVKLNWVAGNALSKPFCCHVPYCGKISTLLTPVHDPLSHRACTVTSLPLATDIVIEETGCTTGI